MEKTITISGKEVRFKSTGGVAKRYKAQFQRDFFKDLTCMVSPLAKAGKDINKIKIDEFVEHLDLEIFEDLAWVYAKTADPSIPDPLTWLDTFDSFPIIDILPELQDLLMLTIDTKKK